MHAKKTNKTKFAVLLLALALLVGGVVGGTLAWLIDTTDPVVNTFTVGDINIELTETDATQGENRLEKSFKMVPGDDISKDPTVTVKENSEACWLFVKVEKSANFDSFMSYKMATGWTELDATNHPGVYYLTVDAATAAAGKSFSVLDGNKVHVLDTVTKAQMNELTEATYPTLTFTAYAVQSANIDRAADAWSVATTGKLPTTTP